MADVHVGYLVVSEPNVFRVRGGVYANVADVLAALNAWGYDEAATRLAPLLDEGLERLPSVLPGIDTAPPQSP